MSEIKTVNFKLAGGMNQDNDPESQGQDTPYRLVNIKTQQLNNSTAYALVNEKGNTELPILMRESNYGSDVNTVTYSANSPLLKEFSIPSVIMAGEKDYWNVTVYYQPEPASTTNSYVVTEQDYSILVWNGAYIYHYTPQNISIPFNSSNKTYESYEDEAKVLKLGTIQEVQTNKLLDLENITKGYGLAEGRVTILLYRPSVTEAEKKLNSYYTVIDYFVESSSTILGVDLGGMPVAEYLVEASSTDSFDNSRYPVISKLRLGSAMWVGKKSNGQVSAESPLVGYVTYPLYNEIIATTEIGIKEVVVITSNIEYDSSQNTLDANTETNRINEIIKLTLCEGSFNYIEAVLLFKGDLNICKTWDITSTFIYENSSLQKLYWVDGHNQLRYLNVSPEVSRYKDGTLVVEDNKYKIIKWYTDPNVVASNPNFTQNHYIKVTKREGGGYFQAGVIQWAFTYYNKYGAETNLVDMTPLYYISPEYKGAKADDIISCSFQIDFYNIDTSFEYLRLYSIQRSSLNGTPEVKVVGNYKLKQI